MDKIIAKSSQRVQAEVTLSAMLFSTPKHENNRVCDSSKVLFLANQISDSRAFTKWIPPMM